MQDLTAFFSSDSVPSLKARFHYEQEMKHSLFLSLIFPRLKFKLALSEAKKSIKQTKSALFHARNGNQSSVSKQQATGAYTTVGSTKGLKNLIEQNKKLSNQAIKDS